MGQNILQRVRNFGDQLIKICIQGWKREIHRLKKRNRQKEWQIGIGICILISVLLWKPLLDEAFKIGLVFGISYL